MCKTIMKTEVMYMKESKDRYTDGFRGRKERNMMKLYFQREKILF